jgi:endogenous inhibitor of DNA gyrase (YacG/DUF329 family)
MTTTTAPTRTPKPTARERARQAICPNCGGEVVRRSARGPMPTFCSTACRVDHNNRHIVEGRAVVALLKAWRIDRGTGEIAQLAFAESCRILDQFNSQDRDAQRPRADLYAAKLLADGSMFTDRQHAANAKRARARTEAEQAAA